MPNFIVHTLETAPVRSKPMLEKVSKALGFVPNLFGVFAESPAALQGALAMGEAFSQSMLSTIEQQLVAIVVSEANDCGFCVAAHSTFAKRIVGVNPALISAARSREPLSDGKLDALVSFTRTLVKQRGFVGDTDVEAFLSAGYTKGHVLEVLLGVGMKTFNNYADHIAHVPLNDQFKAEAWQPDRTMTPAHGAAADRAA